jgi:hypothetical protein
MDFHVYLDVLGCHGRFRVFDGTLHLAKKLPHMKMKKTIAERVDSSMEGEDL